MAGKSALIFGGTAGIGLATAHCLARDGYEAVFVSGRGESRGRTAVTELESAFPDCRFRYLQCDVSDHHQVRTALHMAEAPDTIVSSISPPIFPCLMKDSDPETYPLLLNNALLGVMNICKHATEVMREKGGGSLITIATDAAKVPTPGETLIGAVMAGIVMLSRTVALEEKRHGIRVNCVTPSIVRGTPFYDAMMQDPFCGKLFAKAESRADLGVVEAEDVAETIAYLASDRARKVTGQVISVNGGIST